MASAGQPQNEGATDELPLEKNAGLIMGVRILQCLAFFSLFFFYSLLLQTNNSSIVSKRSVEKLYLPQPHFYRYFVRKPLRRSPTINRGYWLRMRAIDWVVRQFLEKPTDQQKIIVNLGCG